MIYDARTNPRGFGLRIDQWPKDAQVRRIARMGGYRIPAPSFTAPDATPARALLNHGVWRAWCPDCPFSAEDVWRGHNLFWCMRCGNLKAGRAWRPLVWPPNVDEIEAILADYPPQVQNWEPWGPAVDLKAEAEAWLEKAAPMLDPEHGLSDNEVGGEDDPETYTTPVLAVTNAIIASSDANVDKGDIRYFRQYMPANPGGANYWLQSTGTDGAAWVARATAVLAALGFTPINKAGDSGISGILVWSDDGDGVQFSQGSLITDFVGGGLTVYCDTDQLRVFNQAGTTLLLTVNDTEPSYKTNKIWHAGNDGSGSGLDADTVDGLQPGNSSGNIAVANGTVVTDLNADNLDGLTWKQGKTGEFSGSQALTTSFADVAGASFSADRDGMWLVILNAEFAYAIGDGQPKCLIVSGGVNQEEGFGVYVPGATTVSVALAVALVSVSGTTTIKAQVKKESGSGGSTCSYAKITGIWLAP